MEKRDAPEPDQDQLDIDTDTNTGPPEPDRLPDGNMIGENNIREGRVGGVIGGPHQQGGEGGGG